MIIYLNNILILTWMLEKHYQAIHSVIEVLTKYKLFLYPKKYKFDKWQIKYLDLAILEDWVEMNLIKVAEVWD